MAGTPRYEGEGYESYGRGGEQEAERRGAEFGREVGNVAREAGSRLQDVKESVSDASARAKQAAHERMESIRQVGAQTAQRLEDRIQNDPIMSCLIAAGAGLCLGFVLGAMWSGRD
jgi:ElaB/YqjD/DUF883 family membrane-anchored ribosome-binding protein